MKKYYNGFYSVEVTKDQIVKAVRSTWNHSDWNAALQHLCLNDTWPDLSDDSKDPVIGWNQKNAAAEVGVYRYGGITRYTLNCVTNESCDVDEDGVEDNIGIDSMCDFSAEDIEWLKKELNI